MTSLIPPNVADFLDAATAEPSPLLREMDEHGRERDFPTVGPQAGRFLRVVARLTGAERVFEFGSGFGYSAAWFLGALPDDGEIVLTDYDADNLAEARDFLSRAESDATVHYEVGDARETFADHEGPFDVVFVDNDKDQYVEAFELARESVPVGGAVVADNALTSGLMDPEDITAVLEGGEAESDHVAGVAAYVEHVRDDPAFETSYVPLGEGVAVSVRTE